MMGLDFFIVRKNILVSKIAVLFLVSNSTLFASLAVADNSISCRQAFATQSHKATLQKALNRANGLNPKLQEAFFKLPEVERNLSGLYLILKEEAWRLMPNGLISWTNKPTLDAELVDHIRMDSKKIYSLESLNDDEIYIFYANSLQGQYIIIAETIKNDFVNSMSLKADPQPFKNFIENLFYDLVGTNLGLAELEPQRAYDALSVNLEKSLSWPLIIKLAKRFYRVNSDASPLLWLEGQPESTALSSAESLLFVNNIQKEKSTRKNKYCCLDSSGCLFCPNNRAFLIDRN